MTPLLAVLEFSDYAIITVIVGVFAGGAAYTKRTDVNLLRMQRQMRELQDKLDALLRHQGIQWPSPSPCGLSPEVQLLARDPSQMIAAIKLHREENPGMGLREAKEEIEAFLKYRR